MDGLLWKTLLKWMIWGCPYFWKHPHQWKDTESNLKNWSHAFPIPVIFTFRQAFQRTAQVTNLDSTYLAFWGGHQPWKLKGWRSDPNLEPWIRDCDSLIPSFEICSLKNFGQNPSGKMVEKVSIHYPRPWWYYWPSIPTNSPGKMGIRGVFVL